MKKLMVYAPLLILSFQYFSLSAVRIERITNKTTTDAYIYGVKSFSEPQLEGKFSYETKAFVIKAGAESQGPVEFDSKHIAIVFGTKIYSNIGPYEKLAQLIIWPVGYTVETKN
jgi:hypothetical protein